MNTSSKRVGNLVILLMGKKRVGKNTAAQVIRREIESKIEVSVGTDGKVSRGCLVQEFAFADELRRHLSIMNPIVSLCGNYRWNDAIEKYGYETAKDKFPEMRRLMEIYGTEVVRNRVNENYWANYVRSEVEKFNFESNSNGFDTVSLITDCRFLNEVRAFEYTRYKLGTIEILGILRGSVDDGGKHPSNAGLDALNDSHGYGLDISCIGTINNNGSINEFEERVKSAWKQIRGGKDALDEAMLVKSPS